MTRNEKAMKFGSFFIVACLLLLISGCWNEAPEQEQPATEAGSFSLILSMGNGRTILPESVSLDMFESIELNFINIETDISRNFYVYPDDVVPIDEYNLKVGPINLENGVYNLTVRAYLDGGGNLLAATGEKKGISILGPGTSTVPMQFLMGEAEGTFSWGIDFNFSDESGLSTSDLTKANMSIFSLDTEPNELLHTFYFDNVESGTPKVSFHNSFDGLLSGYYRVVFTLEIPGRQPIIRWETLHIYPGHESRFDWTFTDADFNNITYTVTFLHNYGITLIEIPVIHGKTVLKTIQDMGIDVPLPERSITIMCNVIFDSDGGTPVPGQTGVPCTFNLDWYWDPPPGNFRVPYNFDLPVLGDRTLYAGWTPTITVDPPPNKPSRGDDEFINWYTDFSNWYFEDALDRTNWNFFSSNAWLHSFFDYDSAGNLITSSAIGYTSTSKPADVSTADVTGIGIITLRAIWRREP